VVLAIADEATIKSLDSTKGCWRRLTILGRPTEAEASEIIHKTRQADLLGHHGIHSPETRPRMLIRAGVPFDRRRDAVHSDYPQQFDHLYYSRRRGSTDARSRWTRIITARENRQGPSAADVLGQVRRHDNNRDGMGQYLKLTQNITNKFWKAPDDPARFTRSAVVFIRLDRDRSDNNRWTDSRSTCGGCWEDRSDGDAKRGVPGVFHVRVLRRWGAN